MPLKFTNNASASLATSITNSATSLSLTAGQGAYFPTLLAGDYFYATLVDSSNNLEIVKVTARSTDVLTIVRAQDGTLARAFTAGDKVELRPVAAALNEFVQLTSDQTIGGIKTFSNSVIIDSVSLTVGAASVGAGGNIRHKNDSGVVQWVAGILGSAGATSYEWYNNVAAAVRLSLDLTGNLTASGNVTAYSDERVKKDWENLNASFISALATVKMGTFTRIDTGERQVGVSAQSLQKVLPEAVMTDSEGNLSVAYGNAALVAAIELAKQVQTLTQQVQELQAKVEERNS